MAKTLTIQTGVALFKGYTAVGEPQKFYVPIVEFNDGASVAGCVVLTVRGEVAKRAEADQFVIGRAYRIDYTRENREVVRVIGEVDTMGGLVQ